MVLQPFNSITVGELGGRNDDIRAAVGEVSVSLTTDGASQIDLAVSDPGFDMHNAGYFVIRRQIHFDDLHFEIAAVEVTGTAGRPDKVRVTARSRIVQRLKRNTGSANFGTISGTQFAQQMAAQEGMGFFGEASAMKGAILRAQNDTTEESSWDVLKRLARDLKFIVFDDGKILYFASEAFIISKQPQITVAWPGQADASYPLYRINLRRSDDDPTGSEVTMTMGRPNATLLRPGMVVNIEGFSYFDQPHMITSVEWRENSPRPVTVGARTPKDTADIGCATKTFKRGSKGACVKRIQQAVGATADGIFGPLTEAAVSSFQTANNISANGIVGKDTWKAIENS